jgi:hypothetical protein
MRKRWRYVLPIIGLMCFTAITMGSLRRRAETKYPSDRIFYWSSIRLDRAPNTLEVPKSSECGKDETCVGWDRYQFYVDPGPLVKALMVFGFPAFLVGIPIVRLFGHLGIDELVVFMIVMPLSIWAWFYLMGLVLDRRRLRVGASSQNA